MKAPGVIGDELDYLTLFVSEGRVTLEVAGDHVFVVGRAVAREAGATAVRPCLRAFIEEA